MLSRKILAAVAAWLLMSPMAQAADPLGVAISQRGFWNSMFIPVGQAQGFFDAENLELKIVYTEGGATTLNTVISGSVDVAMSNGFLGTIAAYVKGAPLRVIAAETDGSPDVFWYVKASSPIKSLADAEGKTIAFSSPGSSTNLTILDLVRQAGIHPKLVPTGGLPATYTQVMSDQIDIGWGVPPVTLKDVESGQLRIVARGSDSAGLAKQTVRVDIVNSNTLAARRDVVLRFMRALGKSIDFCYSSDVALEMFAKENNVSMALARRTRDEFFPRGTMDLPPLIGVDLVLKDAASFKYIPKPMVAADIAPLFDILPPAKK